MADIGRIDRGHYDEEARPVLSAQTTSPRMRAGLLALTLLAGALTVVTLVAAISLPSGVLSLGTPGVGMVGLMVVLIAMLLIVFGALLENNRALDLASHRLWIVAFVVAGPFALLAYWVLHVWRAPYETGRT